MDTKQDQSANVQRPALKAETLGDLRELLGQAKRMIAQLPGSGAEAQTLLFRLDAIWGLFSRLEGAGADLRAEASRWEAIESAVREQDAVLLRELRSVGGLAALRAQVNPAPEQWWWFLDRGVTQRRQGEKRRTLWIVGATAAALLLAVIVFRFVLPSDSGTTTAANKRSQAESALEEGDLAAAALAYRQAAEIEPGNPELHVWVGVLEELQGNTDAADEAYANAERLADSPTRFYLLRGTARSEAGALDLAIADAQAALAIEPNSAEAYLLLAGIYETQGERGKAAQVLEKAQELAEASDNPALVAAIKMRLGMMSQQAPEMPTMSGTALPQATR